MLTVLFWIGGLVASYFAVTFLLHVYRIKTDSRYRGRLEEAELERHLQQRVQRILRGTDEALP